MHFRKVIFFLFIILTQSLLFSSKVRNENEIKEILNRIKAEGKDKGYTFSVGFSEVMKYHIEDICRYIPPERFRNLKPSPYARKPIRRDLPSRWDWREHGGCTPVKNQGSCGGCWAFSTIGCVESVVLINDGIEMDLSEQNLISCDSECNGCGGGSIALNYVKEKGAVYESCDPYQGRDTICKTNCPTPVYLHDWKYIGEGGDVPFLKGNSGCLFKEYSVPSVDDIKSAIYHYGPVAAAVYVDGNFQAYSGGIYNSCTDATPNHAILLVGWDDSMGENGCWILKNSWGSDWGEDGYMYIEYGCSNVGYSAAYAIYNSPGEPDLDFKGRSWTDTFSGNGNGEVDPGETLDLTVDIVNNFGTDATGIAASLETENSNCTINQSYSEYPDISRGEYKSNNTPFSITFSQDIAKGEVVSFKLHISADGGYHREITFRVVPNPGGIIVYDWDGNKNSGTEFVDILKSQGKECLLVDDYSHLGHLEKFEAVFVCLGCYNFNHVLSDVEANYFKNYLNSGGNLYIEGGDTWVYDPETSVHPYFGINGIEDGEDDLSVIVGESGTMTDGLSFRYLGDNSDIDRISPDISSHPDAILLFKNQNPEYGCMVSNVEDNYRTIGVSFEFGGLEDSDSNTKSDLMKRILNFFGLMSQRGDINGDGRINIQDVVELENYLGGNLLYLSINGSGGDINGDGDINAVDLLHLLQIINDGN